MTMTKKCSIIIGILLILALAACSTPTSIATQPSAATQTQVPTGKTTDYPGPVVANVATTTYPNPQSNATPIIQTGPTPTADPTMGTVTGKLLLNNKGVGNILLYLAEVIKDKSGKDIVAGLDRVNSPNIRTDSEGIFTFVNVKTGRYALILDVVTNQYMINYPDKETPILVDVQAGKVIDLGTLNYDTLPLPPK